MILAQSNAYLDVDPFLTRQGAELVHEDSLGHGERSWMPIRDEMIVSSTRVNLVVGRTVEQGRRAGGAKAETIEREEGAEMGRRKWTDDDEVGARAFRCVARVAILARGERKGPCKNFPLIVRRTFLSLEFVYKGKVPPGCGCRQRSGRIVWRLHLQAPPGTIRQPIMQDQNTVGSHRVWLADKDNEWGTELSPIRSDRQLHQVSR